MKGSLSIFNSKYTVLFNLISLLIIISASDYIVGRFLKNYYFKQKAGVYYSTTYSLQEADQDIMIYGSSRALRHYSPAIISAGLGMSCYNAGRDGQGIFYVEAVIKAQLKRYTPKIALIDLHEEMFKYGHEKIDRLSCLLPYFDSHPEIRPIILKRSKFERIKLLSNVYPYNSMILTIAKNNFAKAGDHYGYMPLSRKMRPSELPPPPKKTKTFDKSSINPDTIKSLETICNMLKTHDVKVVLLISPYFGGSQDPDMKEIVKAHAMEWSVSFFDFSGDENIMQDYRYWADRIHMNNDGAMAYSKKINRVLSQIY